MDDMKCIFGVEYPVIETNVEKSNEKKRKSSQDKKKKKSKAL